MNYLKHYVEYKKSDKKKPDYINEDNEEEKKKKSKRDTRWQDLLQLIAGMETPKVSVTTTHEYPVTIPSNLQQGEVEEEISVPEEKPEIFQGLIMVNKDMAVNSQYFNDWVKTMTEAYKKHGLSDNAIRNLITKNSLESAWGTSELATKHFNFGGLTAGSKWKGKVVNLGDRDKEGKTIVNTFRSYDDLNHFINDEIEFMNLYDFDQNDDIHTFAGKLKGLNKVGRIYAEDPQQYVKLLTRYNQIYGTGSNRNWK